MTLIYLSRQLPRTYIYIYACFFIIYTYFLFDKLYIYTQPKKKKKKKSLAFSIKIILTAIFHKIKFIFSTFIVKFVKSFILNTNYQILC